MSHRATPNPPKLLPSQIVPDAEGQSRRGAVCYPDFPGLPQSFVLNGPSNTNASAVGVSSPGVGTTAGFGSHSNPTFTQYAGPLSVPPFSGTPAPHLDTAASTYDPVQKYGDGQNIPVTISSRFDDFGPPQTYDLSSRIATAPTFQGNPQLVAAASSEALSLGYDVGVHSGLAYHPLQVSSQVSIVNPQPRSQHSHLQPVHPLDISHALVTREVSFTGVPIDNDLDEDNSWIKQFTYLDEQHPPPSDGLSDLRFSPTPDIDTIDSHFQEISQYYHDGVAYINSGPEQTVEPSQLSVIAPSSPVDDLPQCPRGDSCHQLSAPAVACESCLAQGINNLNLLPIPIGCLPRRQVEDRKSKRPHSRLECLSIKYVRARYSEKKYREIVGSLGYSLGSINRSKGRAIQGLLNGNQG